MGPLEVEGDEYPSSPESGRIGDMDFSIQMPAGMLVWLGVKLMPPIIHFGSPVQRGKVEAESFWHIPISIKGRFWNIGPATLPGCRIFVDRYEADSKKEAIRMGWGDMTTEQPRQEELLRKHVVSLVPVAWRAEMGNDRDGYFTDTRFLEDRGDKYHPISSDRIKHKFKLRIKCGGFSRASPYFYVVRAPKSESNGHFVVEVEYEGEGTTG